MDHSYDDDGNELEDEYVITEWISEKPDQDDIGELSVRYAQVMELGKTLLKERDENVPDGEWNTIVDYVDAMEIAFEIAIGTALDGVFLGKEDDGEYDYFYDDDEEYDEEIAFNVSIGTAVDGLGEEDDEEYYSYYYDDDHEEYEEEEEEEEQGNDEL